MSHGEPSSMRGGENPPHGEHQAAPRSCRGRSGHRGPWPVGGRGWGYPGPLCLSTSLLPHGPEPPCPQVSALLWGSLSGTPSHLHNMNNRQIRNSFFFFFHNCFRMCSLTTRQLSARYIPGIISSDHEDTLAKQKLSWGYELTGD